MATGAQRAVKFPSGLKLWLDSTKSLVSDPPEFGEDYRRRHPHPTNLPDQPIGLEALVESILNGELR